MTTATTTSGFINWLYGLAQSNDRGRLAALRRGLLLEPDQMYELYRVIPPQFLEGISEEEARRRMMIAVLFALHPMPYPEPKGASWRRNFGDSLRLLALNKTGRSPEAAEDPLPEPLKRRMDALLAAHPEDLFGHLRQLVRMLAAEEIPVDWEQLLWDLRSWDRPDRKVQWQWSRAFYVGQRETEGGEDRVC